MSSSCIFTIPTLCARMPCFSVEFEVHGCVTCAHGLMTENKGEHPDSLYHILKQLHGVHDVLILEKRYRKTFQSKQKSTLMFNILDITLVIQFSFADWSDLINISNYMNVWGMNITCSFKKTITYNWKYALCFNMSVSSIYKPVQYIYTGHNHTLQVY